MNLERNHLVKLTDGKLYLILETNELNNVRYLYLMEQENPLNLFFYKEEKIGNHVGLVLVTDTEEKERIMKAFYDVMKKTLQEKKGIQD